MGFGQVSDSHAYQVKNASYALPTGDEEFSRGQRTLSDNSVPQKPQESPSFMPQTPSPFMGCQPDPYYVPYTMDLNDNNAEMQPITFGSFGVDDSGQALPASNQISQTFLHYDPNTGLYTPCEYTFVPYDANCFAMQEQGQMLEGERQMPEDQSTMQQIVGEPSMQGDSTLDGSGMVIANGEIEAWDGQQVESWEGGAWENGYGNYGDDQYNCQMMDGKRRADRQLARDQREAARRQDRAEGQSYNRSSSIVQEAWHMAHDRGVAVTTVMFRNIPNKYTREMLVNQLDEDMRGQFDFVYLPIDFKNKCNVGYAFINFCSVEACDQFVAKFNGMEVRRCLPGLNSRKVTEVTPARVQGFEENVNRLKNSPVMRELMHKPEWMPLIFDENGEQLPFPHPERCLEPIKPRRRNVKDERMFRDGYYQE